MMTNNEKLAKSFVSMGDAAKNLASAFERCGAVLGGFNAVMLDVCERTYRATPWWRPLAKWRAWRDLKRARSSAPAKCPHINSAVCDCKPSGTVVNELITKIEFEP